MTEEIFLFSGGGGGNQKGAFKVFFFCHFVSMLFLFFYVKFLLVDQGMQFSFSLSSVRLSVCCVCHLSVHQFSKISFFSVVQ